MKTTKSNSRGHAFVAMLISITLLACSAVLADESNKRDLPEFQLPSYDVDSFNLDITPPVVKEAVVPRLRTNLSGVKVTVTFHIGKDGFIHTIRDNASYYDDRANYVATVMAQTLRSWNFEPALDKDGNPVAIKVRLPVEIVKRSGNAHEYASLGLKKPVILAVLDR